MIVIWFTAVSMNIHLFENLLFEWNPYSHQLQISYGQDLQDKSLNLLGDRATVSANMHKANVYNVRKIWCYKMIHWLHLLFTAYLMTSGPRIYKWTIFSSDDKATLIMESSTFCRALYTMLQSDVTKDWAAYGNIV